MLRRAAGCCVTAFICTLTVAAIEEESDSALEFASPPVIGIFSLPCSSSHPCGSQSDGGKSHCEMLPASYVKYVEGAGARVVPVSCSAKPEEVEMLARSLNGFLFTGGGDMPVPPAMRKLLDLSKAMHQRGIPGDSLPIWGTCLGHELLVDYVAEGALQNDFEAFNLSVPLQLTPAAGQSRMLGEAPKRIMDALAKHPTTFNSHHRGVSPATWAAHPALGQTFNILSTNADSAGREFVSAMEGKAGLPWFSVQFHPEKNVYEQGLAPDGQPWEHIPHGPLAVSAAQYLADFFVSQARRSTHRFENEQDLNARLVFGLPTSQAFAPAYVEVYFLHYDSSTGRPLRGSSPLVAPVGASTMV